MKRILTAVAVLTALTGCSPVVHRLMPQTTGPAAPIEDQCAFGGTGPGCEPPPATTPPVITPEYVMQKCFEAFAVHPDFAVLLRKCPDVLVAVARTNGQYLP